VRRRCFLPKKKSKPTPVPPDVDSQPLTSGVFGVPSYWKNHANAAARRRIKTKHQN